MTEYLWVGYHYFHSENNDGCVLLHVLVPATGTCHVFSGKGPSIAFEAYSLAFSPLLSTRTS